MGNKLICRYHIQREQTSCNKNIRYQTLVSRCPMLSNRKLTAIVFFLMASFCSHVFSANATTTDYLYDNLGRLIRTMNGGAVTFYDYDEVGNLLSVNNSSVTGAPVITGLSPSMLLLGNRTTLTITGQNLGAVNQFITSNGKLTVGRMRQVDNALLVDVTGNSTGSDTLQAISSFGKSTLQPVSVVRSTVVVMPGLFTMEPNSTGSVMVSLNPPLAVTTTVGLSSSNPAIVTIPSTVTIPPGATVHVPINALNAGTAYLPPPASTNLSAKIIVADVVKTANDSVSLPISFSYASPTLSMISTTASTPPVSISFVSPPLSTVPTTAATPVSLLISSLSSQLQGLKTSRPVSISFAYSPQPSVPTTASTPPVSVLFSSLSPQLQGLKTSRPVSISFVSPPLSAVPTAAAATPVSFLISSLSSLLQGLTASRPVSLALAPSQFIPLGTKNAVQVSVLPGTAPYAGVLVAKAISIKINKQP